MADDPLIGLTLNGRYLIEKELGRGAIGAAYLARDKQLMSKPVVVKVLLKESDQNPWFRKKFRQELEALARIDHPGVIGALDAGVMPDGTHYLVMQYVEGTSLRSVIEVDGMHLDRVADIAKQIGQALSAAHEKGVNHRDLKPENIMLQTVSDHEEYVKLIDFGIAAIRDSLISGKQTTKVAGTIAYMAPEQLMGLPSAASDIYALGVIAYEMVTGRRPFNPVSPYQLYEMQRAGVKVKPADLRPSLSKIAQDVILRALAFEPSKRHSRPRDFGEDMARALTARVTGSELSTKATTALYPIQGIGDLAAPVAWREPLDHSPQSRAEGLPRPSRIEPNLGPIVPKTCNRREQANEFRRFFISNLNQRRGIPQFYVVHGEERECHDSLVERLVQKEVRPIAEKKWGEQEGIVTIRKLEWIYDSESSERQYWLKEMLFRQFDPVYTEDDWSLFAFTRLVSCSSGALNVIQHNIHADRWDKLTGELIQWYRSFWESIGQAPSAPQFLVFLNIIYPRFWSRGWRKLSLAALRIGKKRIEAELEKLCKSQVAGCPLLILKELQPLRQDEVKDWFSLNNLYSEKIREELLERMFRTDDGQTVHHKCMAEIEHELQQIVDSMQKNIARARGYL